jgi:HTH-type transcriptional regulator/antitoxin HigA
MGHVSVSEQRKALLPILGSKARVSAVLRGTRKLSPEMIVTLHEELGIPLESLISDVANRARPSRVRKAK